MRLGLDKVAVNVDFAVGDEVKIMSGPLDSFTGKIISLNDATQKAMVKVVVFNRATDVELDYVQIKKTEEQTVATEEINEENSSNP
jgi:transcriptional antiterminator NusG